MRLIRGHRLIWTWLVLVLFAAATVLPAACGAQARAKHGTMLDPVLGELVLCDSSGHDGTGGQPGTPQHTVCLGCQMAVPTLDVPDRPTVEFVQPPLTAGWLVLLADDDRLTSANRHRYHNRGPPERA